MDGALNLPPDEDAVSLASNSSASQKALAAGLKPLLDELAAERDEPGTKNLALGATVTASGTRDPRFRPECIIDNKTWEYPTNGKLDYTLGELKTSPLGGYGLRGRGGWTASRPRRLREYRILLVRRLSRRGR